MIGILVSRITNPFFSYLVDSIEKNSKLLGYNVLVMQTYDDPAAELKMLGYREDEYVGRHIAEFHADQEAIQDILHRLKEGEVLMDHPARRARPPSTRKTPIIKRSATASKATL